MRSSYDLVNSCRDGSSVNACFRVTIAIVLSDCLKTLDLH